MPCGHVSSLFDTFTLQQPLFPCLQVGKFVNVNSGPARTSHPAPVRNVGNGDVISHQVSRFARGEVLIDNIIQTPSLIDVAIYAVFDALRCIAVKVVCLA